MANKGRKLGPKEKAIDPLFTEEMAANLLRREDIALLSGVSVKTFFARLKTQSDLLQAILRGRAKTRHILYAVAFEKAKEGDMEAIKFLSSKLDIMDANSKLDLLEHLDQTSETEDDTTESAE